MKNNLFFVACAGALLLSGCTSMKVDTKSDASHNFSNMHTYSWIDAPADITKGPQYYPYPALQSIIDQELAEDGLQQNISETPADLQAQSYIVLLQEKVASAQEQPRDSREFAGGFVLTKNNKIDFKERPPDQNIYVFEYAKLYVVLTERATGKEIWNGSVKSRIDRNKPDHEIRLRIEELAEKLMRSYPPIPPLN